MYEGYATKEMLQRRWRKDAEYEVRIACSPGSRTACSSER